MKLSRGVITINGMLGLVILLVIVLGLIAGLLIYSSTDSARAETAQREMAARMEKMRYLSENMQYFMDKQGVCYAYADRERWDSTVVSYVPCELVREKLVNR